MKISRRWLQTFFDAPLPDARALADALTFHAFEIESVEDDVLDVKVTPNRGHDCLSHRGIAREISAIMDIPLKEYPHTLPLSVLDQKTDTVAVTIEDSALCARYIAAHVRGVKVGESPAWLRERLESIGQRSINNIVDAANFVMFNIGEPLHAFDAAKLEQSGRTYAIAVRPARDGESIVALDDKAYALNSSILLVADGHSGAPLGIAGIKGGKDSGVSETTTELVLEAATFDGPTLRKTARVLKFKTDATQRFEQVLSPALAAFGMRAFVELVLEVAGGELVGVVDEYPHSQQVKDVSVSLAQINGTLGVSLSAQIVQGVFTRLGLAHTTSNEVFTVTPSPERLDLLIPEDLIEEVARIIGYDTIPALPLPPAVRAPEVNEHHTRNEQVRTFLVNQGFSEVFTSVFAEKGERAVSNKIGGDKPYLRSTLKEGLRDALERNIRNKDLLGVKQVKIFEIGTVWAGGKEEVSFEIAVEKVKKQKLEEEYRSELDAFLLSALRTTDHELQTEPSSPVRYLPFSRYPFIVRDIALWVSEGTTSDEVLSVIRGNAGELLVRSEKFDEFTKDGRTSFAFRLIFQSFDTTLTDEDANSRMASVYAAAQGRGWEVR